MNNYHTHVQRCKHASGTEEDYVLEAIKHGFDELGISDHGPDPANAIGYRMDWEELDDYIAEVSRLKKVYSDKIKIYTGFEYEYKPENDERFLRAIRERDDVDYFALGQHFFINDAGIEKSVFGDVEPDDFKFYAKSVERACRSGMFSFLAHPDVIFMNMTEHSRQADEMIDRVVRTCIEYDMPMEMNANGMRRPLLQTTAGKRYTYPYRPFWDKAAQLGARVIIGSDCHQVQDLCDDKFKEAFRLAAEWGIEVKQLKGEEL